MKLNKEQKLFIEERLNALSKSKFRSSFHLRNYMIKMIEEKGFDIIEKHCIDFIEKNLEKANNPKDGHQTPMKSHPVFIAQHATATCCRGCLEKWYKIPKNRDLTEKEKKFIQALIMSWIEKEYRKKDETCH